MLLIIERNSSTTRKWPLNNSTISGIAPWRAEKSTQLIDITVKNMMVDEQL